MVVKVNVPSTISNAPIGGKLSVQDLMNQAVDRYGQASTPVIPGSQAAQEGVNTYNPVPLSVPPPPAQGMRGVVESNRITAESSPEALAEVTQSPYAGIPRNEPTFDESGRAIIDPNTGEYITRRIPMERFGQEQEAQLDTVPNFDPALMEENPVEMARQIMSTNNKGDFDQATINKFADKMAPTLATITNTTEHDLFNPTEATIGSMQPGYEGVPVGIQVQHQFELPQEQIKPLATIIGISHILATEQSNQLKDSPNTGYTKNDGMIVNAEGEIIEDAVPQVNLINSMINSAQNALERVGIAIPYEAVRQLVEAKIQAEIYNENHRLMQDKNGNWVLGSTPRIKDMARELGYLSEALAGDTRRAPPSKVPQLSGSNFLKPGSQTSRNTMKVPGAKSTVAEAVKDIFGSIAEKFQKKNVISTSKQLDDIKAKMIDDESGYYSTSLFAKRHKMDQATYKNLMGRVSPNKDYDDNNPEDRFNFNNSKVLHARDQMDSRMRMLENDIKKAISLKGLLYSGFIHSSANQRFFRNSDGTDIMASKGGVREMLNFGVQGHVNANSFFNPTRIKELQQRADNIFAKQGQARQDALSDLTPLDRATIGLMEMAVVNYYSFSGAPEVQRKNIKKFSETELINMYTPEIGQTLAAHGKDYNDWLNNKIDSDHPFVINQLSKMPRGESQGYANLWDDMFQIMVVSMNPNNKTPVRLSALNYDDGNQNGIFLQALYSGNSSISTRLGSYNPLLSDMRGHALNIISDQLDELLPDNPEKKEAWAKFFSEAYTKLPDKLASDLFKIPMMQNSYGKDASMFFEHVREFLEDSQEYSNIYGDVLSSVYGNDINAAASDLSNAMESTLRKALNPKFVEALKRAGRMFAIMDTVPTIEGTAKDHWVFSSVDCGFIPDYSKNVMSTSVTSEGQEIIEKAIGQTTTSYMTPTGVVEAPMARRGLNPNASKGIQRFFNKIKKSFDIFENPMGSSLSRQMGVMPIQSTDGDLIKLMMLAVNSKLGMPMPVATVHDALITTADSMHIYRNAYNNIAIPQAIGEISKFGIKLEQSYTQAKEKLFNKLSGEEYIGIGDNGDYPSLGSAFEEISKKIESSAYKEIFLRRSYNSEDTWNKYVAEQKAILKKATDAGWVQGKPNLAVNAKSFRSLFNLAEEAFEMGGANNKFEGWVTNFKKEVEDGWKEFKRNTGKNGIAQMTHA